jgi:hypothetical protein
MARFGHGHPKREPDESGMADNVILPLLCALFLTGWMIND